MAKRQRVLIAPPVTAVDELSTIKEVLLLDLLLSIFARDLKVLEASPLKTKQPYIDLMQRAMDDVTADLAYLRHRLRQKGIKITDERRDRQGIGCVYWCRGYKSSFEMLWHLAKAETEVRMRKYLGEDIRKYVRSDLPEHLKPRWLLAPIRRRRTAEASFGTAAPPDKELNQSENPGPDEGSRNGEHQPMAVPESEIKKAMGRE